MARELAASVSNAAPQNAYRAAPLTVREASHSAPATLNQIR